MEENKDFDLCSSSDEEKKQNETTDNTENKPIIVPGNDNKADNESANELSDKSFGENSEGNARTAGTPNANGANYIYTPGWSDEEKQKNKEKIIEKMAKESLILGVIAIGIGRMCSCFPVSITLGIIAIVKAYKVQKKVGKYQGMALGGLICGIGGVLSGVVAVYDFLVLVAEIVSYIASGEVTAEEVFTVESAINMFR